jgi:hypothetical protein
MATNWKEGDTANMTELNDMNFEREVRQLKVWLEKAANAARMKNARPDERVADQKQNRVLALNHSERQ